MPGGSRQPTLWRGAQPGKKILFPHILAQRLVRRICPHCKTEIEPPNDRIYRDLPPVDQFFRGRGCSHCYYTGFYGQIGVFEFLRINTKVRRLIAKNAYEDELWDIARESGKELVFISVGFETTAPTVAAALLVAAAGRLHRN
jgi:hypothetical protein